MTHTVNVVAGIIFSEHGDKVLLALRRPDQHQGGLWEFPGGKIEPGESQRDALVRELYEETHIQVEQCTHRCTLTHDYPDKQVCLHFWDVRQWAGEPSGREGQMLQWYPLDALAGLEFPEANRVIVDQLTS